MTEVMLDWPHRWLPGMKAIGRRNLPIAWFRVEEHLPRLTGEWSEAVPDLEDAGTRGCILEMVRQAWKDPGAHVWCDHRVGRWQWMARGCIHSVHRPSDEDGYETETGALLAALSTGVFVERSEANEQSEQERERSKK